LTDVETEIDVVLLADAVTPPLTGIGRYTWELAQRLGQQRSGVRLTPLTLSGRRSLSQLSASLGVGEEENRASVPDKRRGAVARFIKAAMRRSPATAGQIETVRRLIYAARLRTSHAPARALVHGPNYFAPPTDRPTVVTIHDLSTVFYPETHPPLRVRRVALMLETAKQCGFEVVTDAAVTKKDIVETLGVAAEKIHVVPLGVGAPFGLTAAEDRQPTLTAYGLRENGYCLSVGSAEPRKNLSRLIAAYATLPPALRREHPLVLAGAPGWRNAALLRDIALAERDGWARNIGCVPQRHLPALYGGARLFAYISLYEGFGLPVAEAMACGTPVLTSNVSSLPEVAAGAAMPVDPADENDIARRLATALSDETWRRRATAAGLRRAAQLSWDRTAAETVAVYRAALKGS
jgi:glycosyltransferase involved in cell wall biosynthesis